MPKTKTPSTKFSPQQARRKIALHCAAGGISLAAFSRQLWPGIVSAPEMLNNLLAGRVAAPGYKTLANMASILGCTVADFME